MAVSIEAAIDFRFISSASCTLTETGGGAATGSIQFTSSDGPYFLSDDNSAGSAPTFPAFIDALKTKLDAVGNATYTVTWDKVTQKITVAASGGSVTAFALTAMNDSFEELTGFTASKSGALTYESDVAPYYQIQTTLGVLSNYGGVIEDGKDGTVDHIAHDGTVYGIAKPGVPVMFTADIPHEPRSIVDDEATDADIPWTWLKFFRYTRNTLPYSLRWDQGDRDLIYYLQNYASDSFLTAKNSKGDALDSHKTVKLKARRIGVREAVAPSPPSFVPTDLGASTLTGWYKADGIVGSPVSAWNDSSGNGRHMTANSLPVASTLAGLACADLDGSDDFFQNGPPIALSTYITSTAHHVFVVCQPEANFSSTTVYPNSVVADAGGYFSVGGYTDTSVNKIATTHWDGNADTVATNYTSGSVVCIEAGHTASTLYLRAHLAGSSSSIVTVTSNAISTLTDTFLIGKGFGGYFEGKIAEVIVVNRALTTQEQSDMRGYLLARFSLNNPGTALY